MEITIIKNCDIRLDGVVQSLQSETRMSLPDDKAKKLIDAGYAKETDKDEDVLALWRWFTLEADRVFRVSSKATASWNRQRGHSEAAVGLCMAGDIPAARVELANALTALLGGHA